ncbi:MAG: hypothetical protein WBH40_09860 [Ignavibacteriaceae bacterium]
MKRLIVFNDEILHPDNSGFRTIIKRIVIPANLACRQVGAGISIIKKIPHQVRNDIEKIINQTKPVILSAAKNIP